MNMGDQATINEIKCRKETMKLNVRKTNQKGDVMKSAIVAMTRELEAQGQRHSQHRWESKRVRERGVSRKEGFNFQVSLGDREKGVLLSKPQRWFIKTLVKVSWTTSILNKLMLRSIDVMSWNFNNWKYMFHIFSCYLIIWLIWISWSVVWIILV